MKPCSLFLFLLLSLALGACKKEVPQPNQPTVGVPEKFADLTVANDFTWGTSRRFTLQFEGYAAPVNVQRSLKVFLPNSSASIYTANFSITSNAAIQLEVPKEVSELVIQYGAITKRLPISSNMVFSPKPEFE